MAVTYQQGRDLFSAANVYPTGRIRQPSNLVVHAQDAQATGQLLYGSNAYQFIISVRIAHNVARFVRYRVSHVAVTYGGEANRAVQEYAITRFRYFFVFVVVVRVSHSGQARSLLRRALRRQIHDPSSDQFGGMACKLVSVSARGSFHVEELFYVVSVTRSVIRQDFVSGHVSGVHRVLSVSRFSFFRRVTSVILCFFPR